MADALGYLLRNGWFGPLRLTQTLTDCASVSALSGYRVAQDRGARRQGVVTCCGGEISLGLVNVYWP